MKKIRIRRTRLDELNSTIPIFCNRCSLITYTVYAALVILIFRVYVNIIEYSMAVRLEDDAVFNDGIGFVVRPYIYIEGMFLQAGTANLILTILLMLVFLAGLFAMSIWIYQVFDILRTLGAKGLRTTSNTAVISLWIPVLNLYKPYGVFKEAYNASKNPTDWDNIVTDFVVVLWWTVWLGVIVVLCYLFYESNVLDVDDFKSTLQLIMTSNIMMMLFAVCTYFVVNRLQASILSQYLRLEEEAEILEDKQEEINQEVEKDLDTATDEELSRFD